LSPTRADAGIESHGMSAFGNLGRLIEFEHVKDWWGVVLPVASGQNAHLLARSWPR